MAPLSGDLRELASGSAGFDIGNITLAGRRLKFHTGAQKLYIALDRQYPEGTPRDFAIRYHAQPRRGMFFVLPDKFRPDRPKQIWTNGAAAGGNHRLLVSLL
jgi:aminopeptidase N